tara:strand:+ start:30398 stop:31375 length:978 start_codon:yes stop_codon:yes gene_type:complete
MLLEVENLSISFETKRGILEAVRGITFHLNEGETLGIVGESGCGKSITNLAIMGLLAPNAIIKADKLNFQGQNLLALKERQLQKIRGGEMGMIFQDPMTALNPSFTVGFQIDETLKVHEKELTKKDRADRAMQLMEQVGIPAPGERLKAYAHELSGGMSQRVMIAMAIACNPKLLIADEPTTALDVTIQDQILTLLKNLQEKHNMAMILVTHDLGVVAQNADRLQVMYAGEVVETGFTSKIIEKPFHPYTKGLLASLPGKETREFRGVLPSIAGLVPDLTARPSGCQFSPRCEFSKEDCTEKLPPLDEIGERKARCFYPVNREHE